MSGHSKWATIKRKKAAIDAKRSKVWTKLIKEIHVAARMGGGDLSANPRLRTAVDKAKGANMPNDTIDRAIKKGTGEGGAVQYDEILYEAYGPAGVAVMIECLTDNRTRTVAEVRNLLEKYGGNLGASGSVAYMFKKRGTILIEKTIVGEDKLMELALEAGAEDVKDQGDLWEVDTDAATFQQVKEAIEKAKIAVVDAEVAMVPANRVPITDEDKARSLVKLIGAIEDNDDVQNVWANHEIDDALMEKIGG
jgi:YebC/PmpR family DNA-binding regulatory protein